MQDTLASEASTQNRSPAIPHNLPRPLTSFIGREAEVGGVARRLQTTPLLTLTGPGGSGKTRLALRVAEELTEPRPAGEVALFPDGIWLVELAALADPQLVPQAVASALAAPEVTGQPLTQTLIEYLRPRHLLLVLDNCEHLLDAVAALALALLRACPALHILATSQVALNLPGEVVTLVPPLPLPDAASPAVTEGQEPQDWLRYAAVRLFVERAQASAPHFTLTAQNAEAVIAVCQRLDGIPLALELAAARVKALPVEQIARRLDDCFRLLTTNNRAALPRHQTLRAAVDWSYSLLSPPAQALLRRLAVFAGGFSLEAVEQALGSFPSVSTAPTSSASDDLLDLLTSLVERSLVIAEPQPDGEARYRLLETIRQYGWQRLREAGEEGDARDRHLAYYLSLAETAAPQLRGRDQVAWLNRLDRDHENLRAALVWSQEGRPDMRLALRLGAALWWFWHLRGHLSEGRRWLGSILARSEADTVDEAQQEYQLARAAALHGAGALAQLQSDYATANESYQQSLVIKRALGDKAGISLTLNNLGGIAYAKGDYATARAWHSERLALAQELGDPWAIAVSLNNLAGVAQQQGDDRQARSLFEQSLAVAREIGDQQGIGRTLNNLGKLVYRDGDHAQARQLYTQSLAIRRQLGDPRGIAASLNSLGGMAMDAGDYAQARQLYTESLAIEREIGDRRGAAYSLHHLGQVALHLGDQAHAEQLHRESLSLFHTVGDRWGMAEALDRLAHLTLLADRAGRAATLYGAAQAVREAMGAPVPPHQRAAHDESLAAVRAALRQVEFDFCWAEGHTLPLEQAVALALATRVEDTRPVEAKRELLPTLTPIPPAAPRQPAPAPASAPRLRVLSLGSAQVFRADTLVTQAEWTLAKARELFFYLLCYPPRTKEQIGVEFWPDASPTQLRDSCRAAVYRLRRALGQPDWIIFDNDTYTVNHELGLWFDLEVFETQVKRLQPEPSVEALAAAVELYRGDFLEDVVGGDWIERRREEVRQVYLDALLSLGGLLFAAGRYADAAERYRQAIARDSYLEIAHREFMRCLARLGERSRAQRHYQSLVEMLHAELGAPPAPETKRLFEQIRRGDEV